MVLSVIIPPFSSWAQQQKQIDSLYKALTIYTKKDSNRVIILNALVWRYRNTDFSKAIELSKQAVDLGEEIGYFRGLSDAYNFTGLIYRNIGDYADAASYYLKALEVAEKHKLKEQIGYANNNLGEAYRFQKQYDKALKYTQDALYIFREIKDKRGEAYAHLRIGEIYENKGNLDYALASFEKSLEIRRSINAKDAIEASLSRIGSIYLEKKEFEKALSYFNEALKLSEELKDKRAVINANQQLAKLFTKQNDLPKAIQYYLTSYELADKINSKEYERRATRALSDLYAQQGNTNKAYEYQSLYVAINDSLTTEEENTRFSLLQKNYELKKKEAELELVNKDNAIKSLVTYALIVILGLAVGLLIVVARANQQRKRANKMLVDQKAEIEQINEVLTVQKNIIEKKNEDITASINYAKRIQSAILPGEFFFTHNFTEFFILYRPRDIVSGDFYWVAEHQGKAVLAVADCTGHGIPGAFMSLIGNDLLNEIINLQGVLEPDKILDLLRIRIRQVLHQDQNETQDGMDIAVLVWEKTKNTVTEPIQLQFAAARHSLLVVQTEQIEQFKGDKLVIGGLNTRISHVPFNKQTISVQAGQSIYLFSDGIVDQFGGEEARKFSSPRLRDLLFKLRHVPLKDQKEIIDNTLDAWMGNEHQQTDDILLIGLKF